jgi:excisionase family DNA binding protein
MTDLLGFLSADVRRALEELVDARLEQRLVELERTNGTQPSEFLTIPEAADLLRCKRARVDDLLSARRIPRVKEGARTLIRRADLDAHLRAETK